MTVVVRDNTLGDRDSVGSVGDREGVGAVVGVGERGSGVDQTEGVEEGVVVGCWVLFDGDVVDQDEGDAVDNTTLAVGIKDGEFCGDIDWCEGCVVG